MYCGISPIAGYIYCSPECRTKAGRTKARKGLSREEREIARQREIDGIGFKVCKQCGVNKQMSEFSRSGGNRKRRSRCNECEAREQKRRKGSHATYRPKKKIHIDLYSKECTKCGVVKSLTDYDKTRRLRAGVASWCKGCKRKQRNKDWRPFDKAASMRRKEELEQKRSLRLQTKKAAQEKKMLEDLRLEAVRCFLMWRKRHATEAWLKEFERGRKRRYWLNKGKYRDKIYRENLSEEQKERLRWNRRAHKLCREAQARALTDRTITGRKLRRLRTSAKECPYCGSMIDADNSHLDHMTPLSLGGEHSIYNVVVCCPDCNMRKNDTPFMQWVNSLREPYKTSMKVLRYNRRASGFLLSGL